jgi:hypothetical protein
MSLNSRLDRLMQRHVAIGCDFSGERATWYAKGATTGGTPVTVQLTELPGELAELGDNMGHQVKRREATILIPADIVPAPDIDTSIVISSGVYAGAWVVIGIDTTDAAATTVRARFDTARRSNAAGSRLQL